MKTSGHRFTHRAGRAMIGGKSYYPDYLRLDLSRRDAFDLAMQLLEAIRSPEPGVGGGTIQVTRLGELTREEEDDLDWPEGAG